MNLQKNKYVIGVDGGGTKTIAALANLKGKILKTSKTGPANPRNIGIVKATQNIAKAVKKVLPKDKKSEIVSVFIGVPSAVEEFKLETKKIKKLLLEKKEISQVLKNKVIVGSDQLVAFRSGTDKKDGIVLIAGTGCVASGWKNKKEYKSSGWGWLTDEGSAFWTGQKVFQAVLKDLDKRGPKTLLTGLVFKKLRVRSPESLLKKIYPKNFINEVSDLCLICDLAAKRNDKIAKDILKEAAKELSLSAKTVIKKMNLSDSSFDLVLVGSMFKSKIVTNYLKKDIKKTAPLAKIIMPKKPVMGSVRLAIDQLK